MNIMITEEFNAGKYWGLSTTIDLVGCDKEKIQDPDWLRDWVLDLVEFLDMEPHGEPVMDIFGNEEHLKGYTVMQMIKTSSITAHFCNATGEAYIDVFSCKGYEPEQVAEYLTASLDAGDYKMSWQFRG